MSRPDNAEPKRILAYGDSLTWGWIPVHVAPPSRRYPTSGRWLGVMREALGTGYDVIEAGLNGHTADLPDLTLPPMSGSGLDGSADLPVTLVISVAFCAKICLRELWWSEVPHLGAGFAGYSVIRVACSEELSTRFLPMAEMLR
jgi:hypothetical protein